jgi:tetratricopeptide (TPR) repeat protein
MRPYQHPKGDNDDKTVFYEEFVTMIEKFGLKSLVRPAGSLDLLKLFVANGVPVVVKTRLKPKEDSAHYRIIRGFEENAKILIVDDSYFGGNRRIPYFELMEMWQPFGYHYLPVYPEEKEPIVKAILGQNLDEKFAWGQARDRALEESQLDPESVHPIFNLSVAYYHLGDYQRSVAEFEKIESRLTKRALWYQIEPILAYRQLKNHDRVFALSDRLFENGNRAFSELYQLRGEIYLAKGDKEAARREFELALKYHKGFKPAEEALLRL